MKKLILMNSFHNTKVTVHTNDTFNPGDEKEYWLLLQLEAQDPRNKNAKRRLKRIEKTLCGMADCKCGVLR